MIWGYARVSIDNQSVGTQLRQPRAAGEAIRKIERDSNVSHSTVSRLSR